MGQSGIYMIKNLINNKCYIGSAVNIKTRRNTHLFELRKNKHHSRHLQNAFNKYGIENLEFIVIETVKDKTELIEREQYYIDLFKSSNSNYGYNMCANARNRLGYKQTDETIMKLRLINTGRVGPNRGRILTEEQKEKIRQSNTGKKRSELSKERYRESKIGCKNPNYGKVYPDEYKRNMSLNSPAAKRVICLETGVIYHSLTEAGIMSKIPATNIGMVCKGKRQHAHGLTFRYAQENGQGELGRVIV